MARVTNQRRLAAVTCIRVAVAVIGSARPHRASTVGTGGCCIGIRRTYLRAAAAVIHIIAYALLAAIIDVAVAAGVAGIASRAATRRSAAGATVAVGAGDATREAVGRRIERSLAASGA
jgi:hypothetical protein